MSQLDMVSYFPILLWFVVLFILAYVCVYSFFFSFFYFNLKIRKDFFKNIVVICYKYYSYILYSKNRYHLSSLYIFNTLNLFLSTSVLWKSLKSKYLTR